MFTEMTNPNVEAGRDQLYQPSKTDDLSEYFKIFKVMSYYTKNFSDFKRKKRIRKVTKKNCIRTIEIKSKKGGWRRQQNERLTKVIWLHGYSTEMLKRYFPKRSLSELLIYRNQFLQIDRSDLQNNQIENRTASEKVFINGNSNQKLKTNFDVIREENENLGRLHSNSCFDESNLINNHFQNKKGNFADKKSKNFINF
jgi:hypothetical protein